MRRIDTLADLADELDGLVAVDPRLKPIRDAAGEVPLRRSPQGFASLVEIVVAQQVSRASADAILARLVRLSGSLDAPSLARAGDDLFREAGLSRPKQKTLRVLSLAAAEARLDLAAVADMEAEAAIASLTAHHGIGAWTAQCYLLFAAGHPDVFPAGDVALQTSVGHALDIAPRPAPRQLAFIAESWRPHRGAAARLFWAYYRTLRGREAAPPAGAGQSRAN